MSTATRLEDIASRASVGPAGFLLGSIALALAYYSLQLFRSMHRFPSVRMDEAVKNGAPEERVPSLYRMTKWMRSTADAIRKPYMVNLQDFGPRIMLPPKYVDDVKNAKEMSLLATSERDQFSTYAGFDAFHAGSQGDVFQDAVRIKLTQALTYFTEDLSDEAGKALHDNLKISDDWNESHLYSLLLNTVTRLSSLIFVGRDFKHLEEWQQISASHTVNVFEAVRVLRTWHPLLRPIAYWFIPSIRQLRAQVKRARALIEPEVAERRKKREEDIKRGIQTKKSLDSVDWFIDSAKGQEFDIAGGELALSVVAIHTTTATLTNVMLDLCANPELFEPLREEIIRVINEDGSLQRTSLHKLKLMDSVMKESQRLHPLGQVNLRRRVLKDYKLHDGTVLPKGAYTFVGPIPEHDPSVWPDPFKFDGYRFLRMRQQAGHENKWQFTTTSSEHLGFGHGMHACPGRFFASNEIKVALMHLLMKFEWKFSEGQAERPESIERGLECVPNPTARLQYKARESEVSI